MNQEQQLVFLSTADLARLCKVATSTVRTWRYSGKGPPAYQFGKHIRYRLDDVEAWMEQGKSGRHESRRQDLPGAPHRRRWQA